MRRLKGPLQRGYKAELYAFYRRRESRLRFFSNKPVQSDHTTGSQEEYSPSLVQPMEQYTDSEYLRMLGSSSPDNLDSLFGVGRVRATRIEAAVRMIADVFAVYDGRDTDLLEHELDNEFGLSDEGDLENDDVTDKDATGKIDRFDDNLLQHLANVKPKENKLDKVFFPSIRRSPSPRADDYIELQAGSDALAYGSKKWGMAWTNLISYLEKYSPNSVEGFRKNIKLNEGIPDIRSISLFMKELTSVQQTKPALLALECMILSEMKLSPEIFITGIKASIEGGHHDFFKRLAGLVDLTETSLKAIKEYNADSFRPISSQLPVSWFWKSSADKKLSSRFFENSAFPTSKQISVLTYLIFGLSRFKEFAHIDTVLRHMVNNNYPLSARILACNFRCSAASRDIIRVQWTWNQLQSLDPKQVDINLLETAANAAKSTDDLQLLRNISDMAKSRNFNIQF